MLILLWLLCGTFTWPPKWSYRWHHRLILSKKSVVSPSAPNESLLKCSLPSTVVTKDHTKCTPDPLKPPKNNMPFVLWSHRKPDVLWPQWWSQSPAALTMIKDKHQSKRKKKKQKKKDTLSSSSQAGKTPRSKFHCRWVTGPAVLIFLSGFAFQSPLDKQKEEPHCQESICPSEQQGNNIGDRKTLQLAHPFCFCFYLGRRDCHSSPC